MANVYLALGTNIGDKEQNMWDAIELINERVGEVISLSAFYSTEPVGFQSPNTFLNAACCVITSLEPFQLLNETEKIEKELGRDHKSIGGVYSDRVMDIDILLYDDLVMNTPQLQIPHPRMWERDFVMVPLKEIL